MNGGLDPEPRNITRELSFKRQILMEDLSKGRIRKEYMDAMYQKAILLTLMIIERENRIPAEELVLLKKLLIPAVVKKWWQFWK